MPSPKRGDVWIVDLGMAAKVRPCLILSIPAADEDRALVTLVPYTTSPRNSRFEIASSTKFVKPGVFDAQNLLPRRWQSWFANWDRCQPIRWRALASPFGAGWACRSRRATIQFAAVEQKIAVLAHNSLLLVR
ncbi:MAG: type II toxin-antitoxin system PemK/MazF family toxin [Pirellulales bacterium]